MPKLHIDPLDPEKKRRAAGIIWEALREIGILLMAFSPLDMALNSDGKGLRWSAMGLFLLAGLLLNYWFNWWWADPIAAIAMALIIGNEGINASTGQRECC